MCFYIIGYHGTDEELDFEVDLVLDRHPDGIACVAWSPDDSVLLTGADCTITMWNTRVGVFFHSLYDMITLFSCLMFI
jgi:WD40 repeat protein